MRATCTYEQAWITAHVQCSGASTHQPQALSTTFPLPTPPQPQMRNENAQHMCDDRCFSILSLLHKRNAQRTTCAMRYIHLPLHHNPTRRMKMRSTSAMIDASIFLCLTSNPCEVKRSKQTAPCCLPNKIPPSWCAHKTARIAQPSSATQNPGRDLMRNARDNKTG